MKKLRVGVVGVGHIGSNHARLYAEIPSAEFTAVYDVEPSRSRTIASKFGAAPAKSLDDFIAMVDAASVATPTNTHYEVARALLAKGKHVLIEKPITDNTAHATELAEVAAHSGLILQVGHVERFNPVLGALEKHLTHPRFIESHRLCPVHRAERRYRRRARFNDSRSRSYFAFRPLASVEYRRRRRASAQPERRHRKRETPF